MFTITDWMYIVQSSPWSSIPGLLRCQGSRSHGSYSGPHPTPTLGWHGGLGGHAAQVQVRLQANTAEDLHSLAHLDLVPALQDPGPLNLSAQLRPSEPQPVVVGVGSYRIHSQSEQVYLTDPFQHGLFLFITSRIEQLPYSEYSTVESKPA